MSLISLTGLPGKGKTLTMTRIAYEYFKKDNPPIKVWFTEKILRKDYVYYIREYTDYPVVFKEKRKKPYFYRDIMGNVKTSETLGTWNFRLFDLVLTNKFMKDAVFFVDEIQAKYDSMEYKDFPDSIAHYCQAHRHFGNDIYISSQSSSRIVKRLLLLSEEYWNIQEFHKFLGIIWLNIRITYELKDSREFSTMTEDKILVDYKTKIFTTKMFKLYDDKYLRGLQESALNYVTSMYETKLMTKEKILYSFFPTEAEKNKINNLRY